MQKPEPAIVVDEASEMPTDERVAALLKKAKGKVIKSKPKGPILAFVTHNGKKTEIHGIVEAPAAGKNLAPFDWYVKKYPMRKADPTADPPVEEIGLSRQFGPFTTSRAMIRASVVYHDLRVTRRKMRKARYRARVIGSILTRRSTPMVTKAEREASLV